MKNIRNFAKSFVRAATSGHASGGLFKTEILVGVVRCPEPPALYIGALYKEKLLELAGGTDRLLNLLKKHKQRPEPRSEFEFIERTARAHAITEGRKHFNNRLLPDEWQNISFVIRARRHLTHHASILKDQRLTPHMH